MESITRTLTKQQATNSSSQLETSQKGKHEAVEIYLVSVMHLMQPRVNGLAIFLLKTKKK